MKKIIDKIIKKIKFKKNTLTYVCYFLLILYPFNATLTDIIYPNKFVMIISVFFPLIILIIMNFKDKLNKSYKNVILLILLVLIIGLIKNYYIIQSRLSRVVLFNLYLFIPFVIALNKNDIRYIMRVIKVFCIEHIFFTYFIFFIN